MNSSLTRTIARSLMISLQLALAALIMPRAVGAVGVTVTPNLITNDYAGKLTVAVTGLAPGQAVVVEKYGDLNANGVINAGEPLLRSSRITDGVQPSIGGVRNVNVPGDEDGAANGQVRVELLYPGTEAGLDVIAGKFLIKVSAASGGFTPVSSPFEVKQKVFPQGAKGRITAVGTGTPLANAPVVLLPSDGEPVTGTFTDANGNYTLYGLPGTYMVLPLAPGHVADFSSRVTLNAGPLATVDLALPAATRTISGKVKDGANGVGIPGVFIQAQSESGQFLGAFSGSDGSYSVGVLAGSWEVQASSGSLMQAGYLGWQNGTPANTTGGNVANLDLPVDAATALIYGTLKNRQSSPVAGIRLYSEDQANQYEIWGARSLPPNADYCMGVRAGSWWVGPDSDTLAALGYTGQGTGVTLTANQALRADFILDQVNAHLIGRVVDNLGAPVADIHIRAEDHQGAGSGVNTDSNGAFNLGVSGGTWYLQLSTEDAEQRQLIGPELPITLASNETRSGIVVVVRRVTARINGQVRNANADPLANVAVYNFINLQGTNYTRRVRTDAGGNYQLPAFEGAWQVSLECNDLQARGYLCPNGEQVAVGGANVTHNIVVQSATSLQITTTSLPEATVGSFYHAQLQASGGSQPYAWSLSPGSSPLPAGLSLGNDGMLTGIPGVTGTFNFSVRVAGAGPQPVADRVLSLTVKPGSLPLLVATSLLADGAVGTFYNQSLNASGGEPPYAWTLAPGSTPLPTGLNLSADGTISGIPGGGGTFFFNVRVTDARSITADGLLSIFIPAAALEIATASLPDAQQDEPYATQLHAVGGQPPYAWSVAPGSLGLPSNLSISTSGAIAGTPTRGGTFFFIVRVTDGSSTFVNRSLSLTIQPLPTLTAQSRSGDQFQLRLAGAAGRTYTIEFSTAPGTAAWLPLTTVTLSDSSAVVTDTAAAETSRFYRARVAP